MCAIEHSQEFAATLRSYLSLLSRSFFSFYRYTLYVYIRDTARDLRWGDTEDQTSEQMMIIRETKLSERA